MADIYTQSELHEFSRSCSSESEVEGIDSDFDSDSDSDWDDVEGDPDFEETDAKFSNLSLTNKSKSRARVVECKGLEDAEEEPKLLDIAENSIDDANFKKVEEIIKAGLLEKLKVEECKLYLRKNGLRLTGKKDLLIQRLKEHQEIISGGGEKKYPPSSFVLNCKGDACVGDVVLFEQNVYEMFNIASRSASGPPCGVRVVAGRIVKESYGAAKQQHTFTIEVLWSKGEKPLSPLHPLLIKGRNLYRLKTLRQKWEDEGKRQNILMEKHSRGCVARAQREARIQEKEKRKTIRESHRVSKKDTVRNQCQTLLSRPTSHCHPQETDTSTNLAKPAFRSENSSFSASTRKEMTSIANKPADHPVTKSYGESIGSGRVSLAVHPPHNHHQPRNRSADYRSTSDVDHIRRAELGSNYISPDFHSREERKFGVKYHHFNAEPNRLTERKHHRQPLASANHFPPLMNNRETYKQKQLCRHYARGRCYYGDNCKFIHDLN